ncbi:MAG: tripartite tricarboxylate transporter TctB family protein [Salinarimonas sp.]|nr:tripartite tricarboxylate transporter TctB family protein [Salinarimonas sp.]
MTQDAYPIARRLRTAFVVALLILFIAVAWAAQDFRLGARLFPVYIGMAGAALCVIELLRQLITRGRQKLSDEPNTADLSVEADEQTAAGYLRALSFFGWMLGYYALTFVFGFTLATVIFVPSLLILRFRAPFLASAAIAGGLVLLIVALQYFLMLRVPRGLTHGMLPWPF